MQIKFRTANPMDFTNVRYAIIFNTSGNGQEPYANGYLSGYANYSFGMFVGGANTSVSPQVFAYVQQPGTNGNLIPVQIFPPPQLLTLQTNTNGQNTEFTITFSRSIFSGGPTASPLPTGATAPPTTLAQQSWNINFITTDPTLVPLDALGTNGKNDVTFSLSVNTATVFDFVQQLTVPAGAVQAPLPAAQLSGGEILNNP